MEYARSVRWTAIVLAMALGNAAPASQPASQPASRPGLTVADLLTPQQLEQKEQALGWWLGGAGTIGVAAGAFALAVAGSTPEGPTRDLERSTGTALVGLGLAVLVAGIYVMVGGDPGPCEIDGTALQGENR